MTATNDILVKSYLDLERDPVNNKHAATKSYVDGKYNALNTAKAAASHTHGAGDINSGELAAARLPVATASAKGAVMVGSGLTMVVSGSQQSGETVGQMKLNLQSGGGLATDSNGALYVSSSHITGLVIGTTEGKAPALDSTGKLSVDVLPRLQLSEVFSVTNSSGLTGLSDAQKGDFAVTDAGEVYVLTKAAYGTASNWKQINNPAAGVTGLKVGSSSATVQTGTVTITAANLGLVTSSSNNLGVTATARDDSFPSEKAVTAYVEGKFNNLYSSLGNSSTFDVAEVYSLEALEEDTGLVSGEGLVLAFGDYTDTMTMAYGQDGSGVDATNDTKFVTAKAAKKIAEDTAASATAAAAKGKIFTITGNGSSTDFTCTHGLGISNILTQVYDSSGKQVWVATEKTSTTVTFKFAEAPETGTNYTAVILGVQEAS